MQYAPVIYNTAVSTAKTAYDKARPVVKDAAAAVKELPARIRTEPNLTIDFIEGAAMPGPVSPANAPRLAGYMTNKGLEELQSYLRSLGKGKQ